AIMKPGSRQSSGPENSQQNESAEKQQSGSPAAAEAREPMHTPGNNASIAAAQADQDASGTLAPPTCPRSAASTIAKPESNTRNANEFLHTAQDNAQDRLRCSILQGTHPLVAATRAAIDGWTSGPPNIHVSLQGAEPEVKSLVKQLLARAQWK